jgi:hypothetical protein
MVFRFHKRTPPDRPISSSAKVVDSLVPVIGGAVMMGEFGGDFTDVIAVCGLLAHRDTAVQLESTADKKATIKHFLVK